MNRLLLMSGGMDSTCIANWYQPEGALTIDYGQRPAKTEIQASKAVCEQLGIDHDVLTVDCSSLGSGDLVAAAPHPDAPCPEWWPFRNQLLVTLGAMYAASRRFDELLLGTVATDEVHVDGSEAFLTQLRALLAMQEGGIELSAPGIGYTAAELVEVSGTDVSLLAWAHSCHVSSLACGQCRGCQKHFGTWRALGWTPH